MLNLMLSFYSLKRCSYKISLEHIKAHIHDNTIMVCTMNGLKHERLIQHYVDESRIVRGVTTWTAGLESPGHTHLMGAGPVEIGALVPKGQANVDVVYELLDQSGLNPHKSERNNQFGRKFV